MGYAEEFAHVHEREWSKTRQWARCSPSLLVLLFEKDARVLATINNGALKIQSIIAHTLLRASRRGPTVA